MVALNVLVLSHLVIRSEVFSVAFAIVCCQLLMLPSSATWVGLANACDHVLARPWAVRPLAGRWDMPKLFGVAIVIVLSVIVCLDSACHYTIACNCLRHALA